MRVPRRATSLIAVMFAVMFGVGTVRSSSKSTLLQGKPGTSSDSGWIDIPSTDFSKGDHLVITVGGSATAVVVRLLPKGSNPNQPNVIVAEKAAVKMSDHTVDVELTADYKHITQVSVHGGPMPWDMFPLGDTNGRAILLKVEHRRP
jgi:hypothetical protein